MGNILLETSRLSLKSITMSNTTSTSTTMNPRIVEKLNRIKYYFASRSSAYNDIWNICHRLSDEIQEQVLDVFILTFIDHWNKELERYVLLCERSLILMDFDFERLEIRQLFIYDYARFNSIRIGPLIYPQMALNCSSHRCKYAIRFQWDSHKPLNYRDYWNPWSKEIPWITLTQHPLIYYIDDLLNEQYNNNIDDSSIIIEDQYFTEEYLQQIRRRFSIETFHDKLFEILNSFQIQPIINYPKLTISLPSSLSTATNAILEDAIRKNILIIIYHNNNNNLSTTIIHYACILCDNYFNITSMFYNRINLGYYCFRFI